MNIAFEGQDLLFMLVPALIAALVRPNWPSWAKFLAAVGVCFLAALVQTAVSGLFDPQHLGISLVKAFGLTMTAYAGFWKRFQTLDWIEANINGGPEIPPSAPKPFSGLDAGGPGVKG